MRVDQKEGATGLIACAALQEAAYGNVADARKAAAEALKKASANPAVAVEAVLALAMVGDTARAAPTCGDTETEGRATSCY